MSLTIMIVGVLYLPIHMLICVRQNESNERGRDRERETGLAVPLYSGWSVGE